MINTKICEWLLNNADAPIRYRTAREFFKDEQTAKKIEPEFLENPIVKIWLKNLHPETPPPRYRSFEHGHGSMDFCLETSMLKAAQIGLHTGISQVSDIMDYYINQIKSDSRSIYIPCFPALVGLDYGIINELILDRLDKLYQFAKNGVYDIYYDKNEKTQLKGMSEKWRSRKVIKREFYHNGFFSYPLIYDIVGLHTFYRLNNQKINDKINAVIQYISTDEFHCTIDDGYGILVAGDKKYHSMGWDPKYPGWFDVTDYIENYNQRQKLNSDRGSGLLFFTQNISKYPPAKKTKWFKDLLNFLEKYKTENDTYIFPKELLPEKQGYAIGGHHMSFGENRKKKNWLEIESTFYMQLLHENI